jgi:hypothetical protein
MIINKKMTAKNLSLTFGKYIFKCHDGTEKTRYKKEVSLLICLFISEYNLIFNIKEDEKSDKKKKSESENTDTKPLLSPRGLQTPRSNTLKDLKDDLDVDYKKKFYETEELRELEKKKFTLLKENNENISNEFNKKVKKIKEEYEDNSERDRKTINDLKKELQRIKDEHEEEILRIKKKHRLLVEEYEEKLSSKKKKNKNKNSDSDSEDEKKKKKKQIQTKNESSEEEEVEKNEGICSLCKSKFKIYSYLRNYKI